MEAKGEVSGRGYQAHSTQRHLRERVDQWSKRTLLPSCSFSEGLAVRGEDSAPEVEGVDVLPVVDGFVSIVRVVLDALAEVNCQLADEGEGGGVGKGGVDEAPELETGVLKEVDVGEVVDGCCAGGFDQALIGAAEEGLFQTGIADYGEAAEDEEGADADGFVVGCG